MTQIHEQDGGPKNPKASPEVFVPLKVVQQIIGNTPLIGQQKRSLLEKFAKLQGGDSQAGVILDPQSLSIIEVLGASKKTTLPIRQ